MTSLPIQVIVLHIVSILFTLFSSTFHYLTIFLCLPVQYHFHLLIFIPVLHHVSLFAFSDISPLLPSPIFPIPPILRYSIHFQFSSYFVIFILLSDTLPSHPPSPLYSYCIIILFSLSFPLPSPLVFHPANC